MTGVKEEMIKVVGKVELEGKLELWKQVYSAEGDSPCVTSALGGGGNSIKIEEMEMIKRAGNIDQPTWQEHHRRVYDSEGDSPTLFADYNGEKCIKVLEDEEMIKRAGKIDDPKWREHWQRIYEPDGDSPTVIANSGENEEKAIKVLEEPQAMRLVRTEECKAKRRETHDVGMSFKEGKYAEPRDDGILGTLTTIEKDNYIAEPFTVASRGRGENNEQHLEVGSSEHTNALTTVEKDNYVAMPIVNCNSKGYEDALPGDGIDLSQPNSQTKRGRVQHERTQTITCADQLGVVMDEPRVFDAYNHREIDSDRIGSLTTATNHGSGNTGTFYVGNPGYRIRKLTEKECFRLMGVKDEDSERVHKNQSKSSMYHLAGDSIVTACLMGLFGEMYGMDWQSKVRELQDDLTRETRTERKPSNDH